jgi:hypothetical protein
MGEERQAATVEDRVQDAIVEEAATLSGEKDHYPAGAMALSRQFSKDARKEDP